MRTSEGGQGGASAPVVVYQDPYQRIERSTIERGGRSREYFVTRCPDRVGMLVVRDGRVLLTRQFRFLVGGLALEVPGGKVETGEDARSAAIRECLEETGFRPLDPSHMLTFQPSLDTWHNPTHLFCAGEVVAQPQARMADEAEPPAWVPLRKCIEMVSSGEITDSLSIIALLAYARRSST